MTHWFYHFSKFVLWIFFRVGFSLSVHGREHIPKTGGFILASNHVSYLDPPLLGAACPRRLCFMARATLFEAPLLGAFMRGVGVMPLQRGESDVSAMREAVRRLRTGEAIAIFPEGGRQFSGQLGTARRGVGLLAEAAQVPVIPVVVKGTFEALPPTSGRLRRAKIQVAFGAQISYTAASTRPLHELALEPLSLASGPHSRARERHAQFAAKVTHAWHRLTEQLHGT